MTPLERYRAERASGRLLPDAAQARVVAALQRIHEQLGASSRRGRMLAGLRAVLGSTEGGTPVRGLYLWGGVGSGKTHLVNGFHETLPVGTGLRMHFHSFMQHVHAELKTLGGRQDPLVTVAERLRARARVLSLDEFHVSDITDAMLLGRLLEVLFERGLTLVTTSNIAPDDLYRDGLQRQGFLPAIAALKVHTRVLHLDCGTDYRLRALTRAPTYHSPLGASAAARLAACFAGLAPENTRERETLCIGGRQVPALRQADGVAWFDFGALCGGPRATSDYMEIARRFHTVLLSDVPVLGAGREDEAARFIHLVDEFYERGVNLVISAQAAPADLYPAGRLAFQFERTRSRLVEMQSQEYLASRHLP